MHTTKGTRFHYFHRSDLSGDVVITDRGTGATIVCVPGADLIQMVAGYVRGRRISDLEQADDTDVLGILEEAG